MRVITRWRILWPAFPRAIQKLERAPVYNYYFIGALQVAGGVIDCAAMIRNLSYMLCTACLLTLHAVVAMADPLPKIELQTAFPALTVRRPVWMSEAPDGSGRFFIVEQPGVILVVHGGTDGSDHKEFLNIEDRKPEVDNEEGLMSIAFHPGFKTNGLFYVYYNQQNPKSARPLYPRRSVISEFKVSASDPDKADMASERVLLEVPQPFGNHKGGELCFGPDGYLYLGLGDGGLGCDPFNNGQSTSTLLAKMLRIDVNSRVTVGEGRNQRDLQYGFPPDNPFINEPDMHGVGVRKEIFAYGLRNPWRYSFDRQTGDLWVGDVGQDLWEEVDLIVKGGDYGWSAREGTHYFKPSPPGAKYIDPVMEYPHKPELLSQSLYPDHTIGLCIIGGYVYRGSKYPSLQGVYLYGDYNLGTIWGFRYENGKVTQQGELLEQPKNIGSFAEDQSGELYVLTLDVSDGSGHIFSVSVPGGK
jgi:glucose/arabinose dehydrogenase